MRVVFLGFAAFLFFAATAWTPEDNTLPARRLDVPITLAPSAFPYVHLKPEVSLKGSPESLIWQNLKLTLEGMERFWNDRHIGEAIQAGRLLPLALGECLVADNWLDRRWHFVLERVNSFLSGFGRTVCSEFGRPVKVNSAVRHVPRQLQLILGTGFDGRNYNAAPVSGPRASPHLTGAAVDIAILGMPKGFLEVASEILLGLEGAGLIDATLETEAANVLHITVFREYK